jgi:hypothetical protein
MEIQVTGYELLELWNNINDPALGPIEDAKVAYALLRTSDKLKSEVKVFEEIIKPKKEFEEYNRKRQDLCTKYARKDENNQPVIINNQFVFDNREAFDSEFDPLKAENEEAIEYRKKQEENYSKLLEDTITVSVHSISAKHLESIKPKVKVGQWRLLKRLITWDNEETESEPKLKVVEKAEKSSQKISEA